MNGNTYRTLEFEAIRELLLGWAGSVPGRSRIRALAPHLDAADVRSALRRTTEAVRLLGILGRQPYHDLPDLSPILPSVRVAGLHLEPRALLDVASFVDGAGEVARRVAGVDGAPGLARLAGGVRDLHPLAGRIRAAILPSGEVSDDASPRLRELRRSLVRLRAELHSVMDSFLKEKDSERLLQEKLITTRNERYVLLLKAEHRGSLPGIIHGSSGSGASLFVEPLKAVDLNNDLVSLGDDERHEVLSILRALTSGVADHLVELEAAESIMGELDAAQATALLSRELAAVEPGIDDGAAPALDLRDARHPLLMPRIAERLDRARRPLSEPVPVSLRAGASSPVLVISGPNTGGKTVALKTVGLLALMAQCGLHISAAAGSVLPVFRKIFADIGDDQSIAESLSTFSAHLASIVEMSRDLALPALVLLDEVGAGTDPGEGGALGVAIVDHFRTQGALVLATTHHGLLKAYAQSTPGVGCASFGYDPATYAPTYQLALGVPGRSLALEMAERLGLAPAVVAEARSRLDRREAQAEALLKQLEEGRAALERDRARLFEERARIEALEAGIQGRLEALEARARAQAESFLKELRKQGEEAARKMADAVHQAVRRVEAARGSLAQASSRARTEALGTIREAHEQVARAAGPVAERSLGAPPAVGTRVRVQSLSLVGDVLALHAGGAEVAVGGKRLVVPISELEPLGGVPRTAPAAPGFSGPSGAARKSVPAEINLVGLTVDEALPQVDKLLDDAALSERREIRVIHGFGAGRLRKAVTSLLEGHPHVAAFRAGGKGEGGGGVTVVELKD